MKSAVSVNEGLTDSGGGRGREGQVRDSVEVVVVWRLLHKATHKIHLKKIPLLIFISCFRRIKHKHLGSNVCFHTWRVKKIVLG